MRGTQLTIVGVLSLVIAGGAGACGPSDRESPTTGGVDGGDEGGGGGGGGGAGSCGTEGNDLIYVVDVDYNFSSFDPSKLGTGDPFTSIGSLSCPAGAPWPGVGGTQATPFSMSVDRSGSAWVLYSSGEIFKVSIADASCTPSGFTKGQQGMELFGMGFVSESEGSDLESLFISGGPAEQPANGDLGRLEPAEMVVSTVGSLPFSEYNPEMTGTGNGELYAYFPGSFETYVAKMNEATAGIEQQWPLDPLDGLATAWAFAHWGGKFYIFISTQGFGGAVSKVLVLDPATGGESVAVANSAYQVVGAGVSTCAPTVVD